MWESMSVKKKKESPNLDRKEKMRELYLSGKTLDEVGKEFCISRQRVFQIIGGNAKFRRVTDKQLENVKYIGLRKWMKENNVSMTQLTRLIYGESLGTNYQVVRNRVCSYKEIPKSFIDKLIEITGLPYEVLFREEDGGGEK